MIAISPSMQMAREKQNKNPNLRVQHAGFLCDSAHDISKRQREYSQES